MSSGFDRQQHRNRNSQSRLSRQGFAPIADNMERPGDATMNIPLNTVQTNTSYHPQRDNSTSPFVSGPNEKPSDASGPKRRIAFAGHRVKKSPKERATGHVGYDGEEDTINRMGMIYKKFKEFSIITRYSVYVVPVALCIAIPIIVGALNNGAYKARIGGKNGVSIVWFFTWIEIVWLSLWVSKIVAHYLPYIFQILAGVVSSGTRKYALVIKSLEIPLSLLGWSVTSLVTFTPVSL